MHANLIHLWRHQARTGALAVGGSETKVRFAPVAIAPVATPAREGYDGDAAIIEVVLRNGRVLRLWESVAPDGAARFADALENCR